MPNKETKKIELVHKQKRLLLYFSILAIVVTLLVSIFLLVKQTNYRQVKIGNVTYKLEVADNADMRAKGLSDRDSLPANTGMLFDFGAYGDWRMWMHRMRFDIDLAWLNKEGKIIYIKHKATPSDYPNTYQADDSSWYVIEVPAGTFESNGVNKGDSVAL